MTTTPNKIAREYQSPRFMVDNLARDADISFIRGAEDPDHPVSIRGKDGLTSIIGEMLGPVSESPRILIDLKAHPDNLHRPSPRGLILSGTNFHILQGTVMQVNADDDPTFTASAAVNCYEPDDRLAEVPAVYSEYRFVGKHARGITVVDLTGIADEITFPEFQYWFLTIHGGEIYGVANPSINYEIGEIFLGPILETTSGINTVWSDGEETASIIVETDAHAVFSKTRGEQRRVFNLNYRFLNDIDTQTLDYLTRQAGIESNAFWFYPPATMRDTETIDTIPTAGWVEGAFTTLSFVPLGSLGDTYMHVVAAGPTPSAYLDISQQSLRGKYLIFDARMTPDDITVDSYWYVDLLTQSLVGTASRKYSISKYAILGSTYTGRLWVRIAIDLDRETLASNSSVGVITNLDKIDRIEFAGLNVLTDAELDIKNVRIESATEQPMFVELTAFDKRQSSQVPGRSLAWDYDLVLRERIS